MRDHVHGQASVANWLVPMLTDTGAANAYAVAATPAPIAYVTGMQIVFKAANTNTGASTLNVNSLGTRSLKKFSAAAKVSLDANDIGSGQVVIAVYDGTDFLMAAATPSETTPVEQILEFYEDFESLASTLAPAAGAIVASKYQWHGRGGVTTQGIGGRRSVIGDGANAGALSLYDQTTGGVMFAAAKNPDLRVRWALLGAVAGLRRLGLFATTVNNDLGSEPTNGIFFRHNTTGNIIAVARSADVESTLDTAVAIAAAGTFQTGRLLTSGGGTNVEAFIAAVSRGNLTTNIPSATMKVGAGGILDSANGLDVDYIHLKESR